MEFALGSFISNVVASASGDGTDEERGGQCEAEADGDDEGAGGKLHGDAVGGIFLVSVMASGWVCNRSVLPKGQ